MILGSLIQVLIPRDWLLRTLGQSRFRGTLLGTLFSLPGMMCTCCAAPVAAGMRRQQVSMGGALAFWMGNPVLNPATLVFMGFVLGWGFAAIRLVAGLVMVLLIATLVQKWVRETPQTQAPVEIDIPEAQGGFFLAAGAGRYGRFSGVRSRFTSLQYWCWVPLASGYSPHADGAVDNSLMWVVAMAVAGCLFVIPTAAEIPIVQTMMLAGMGTAPALALLMTLPAVSLPSLIMLRKAFPAKALWLTGAMVAVSGVIVGGLALLF